MKNYEAIEHLLSVDNPTTAPTLRDNFDCLRRAVRGDDMAIDEFIINNMRLVSAVVIKFISIHPSAVYLEDDLFSEGLLTLTRGVRDRVMVMREAFDELGELDAIDELVENDDYNTIGWLYVAISRQVQECYERDSSEPISKRYRERHTPPGSSSPTLKIDFANRWIDCDLCDPFQEIFLLEDILGACKDEVDTGMVYCRLDGLTQKDVAEKLGVSVKTVRSREKNLYRRYHKQKGVSIEGKELLHQRTGIRKVTK
jgi:hypothetical protein